MSQQGKNEGLRVLDDFVTVAICEREISKSKPTKHGVSSSPTVVQEIVLQNQTSDETKADRDDSASNDVTAVLRLRQTD